MKVEALTDERKDEAMTALNGPMTKPATSGDVPSVSGKIALLHLLRDSAVREKRDHIAVDDGSHRTCLLCGEPGTMYPVQGQPGTKRFQHKRGWGGRAKRSKVNLTVSDMARCLGMGEHTVAHLLWSLQKQGLVTFRENKGVTPGARTTALENIQLTPLGAATGNINRHGTVEDRIAKVESQINGKARGTTESDDVDVAVDVAVEGFVDKAMAWVAEPEPEPEPEPESAVEPDGETPVEPTPEPERLPVRIMALNADKYPGLIDLLSRESKRRAAIEATALLEKAGLTDLALQSITAIPDNKPLEQEVIDYLTEIGVRP